MPALDLCHRDEPEGIVRTLGAGSGLLVGQVRRHRREPIQVADDHVFGMSTERALVVSEHPVADLEGRDTAADRLDLSRKLGPEDRRSWPDEPGEESQDEGFAPWTPQSVRFTVVA